LRSSAALAVAISLVTACSGAKTPIIVLPAKIDSFCTGTNTAPRATGLAAVMTSTDDKLLPLHRDAGAIEREVRSATGAIGHWNDQLLALPVTAKALGESDGYVRVDALAVPEAKPGADNRIVYFQVRDHGAPRWIALTAYDVQNVCIAGRPQA
jgi:hypothetical protein